MLRITSTVKMTSMMRMIRVMARIVMMMMMMMMLVKVLMMATRMMNAMMVVLMMMMMTMMMRIVCVMTLTIHANHDKEDAGKVLRTSLFRGRDSLAAKWLQKQIRATAIRAQTDSILYTVEEWASTKWLSLAQRGPGTMGLRARPSGEPWRRLRAARSPQEGPTCSLWARAVGAFYIGCLWTTKNAACACTSAMRRRCSCVAAERGFYSPCTPSTSRSGDCSGMQME